MNSTQKVIKYIAVAFAIFLAFSIISAIISFSAMILRFSGLIDRGKSRETADFHDTFDNVENLNVKIDAGDFKIVEGDSIKIEALNVSDEFTAEVEGKTLVIKESKVDFFDFIFRKEKSDITLKIPKDYTFTDVDIEFGAGKAEASDIKASNIKFKSGAGKVSCYGVKAEKAVIESGVGEFYFEDSILNDVSLSCGVGKFEYNGSMTGYCTVISGVGKTVLNLKNKKEEFEIKAKTGIGEMTVDSDKLHNDSVLNSGAKNKIRITGGVGKTEINFSI